MRFDDEIHSDRLGTIVPMDQGPTGNFLAAWRIVLAVVLDRNGRCSVIGSLAMRLRSAAAPRLKPESSTSSPSRRRA